MTNKWKLIFGLLGKISNFSSNRGTITENLEHLLYIFFHPFFNGGGRCPARRSPLLGFMAAGLFDLRHATARRMWGRGKLRRTKGEHSAPFNRHEECNNSQRTGAGYLCNFSKRKCPEERFDRCKRLVWGDRCWHHNANMCGRPPGEVFDCRLYGLQRSCTGNFLQF